MSYRDDQDALHERVQELERDLQRARTEAAGRKEAQAEVERLNKSLAKAMRELERLRPPVAQEPDQQKRRVFILVGALSAAMLIAGVVMVLLLRGTAEHVAAPQAVRPVTAPANAEGSLDEHVAARIVQRHSGEIRSCYNRELQATPSLEGSVTLQLRVAEGRATPIVESTLRDANREVLSRAARRVETCIVAAVRQWSFPRGSLLLKYPIVFRQSK